MEKTEVNLNDNDLHLYLIENRMRRCKGIVDQVERNESRRGLSVVAAFSLVCCLHE